MADPRQYPHRALKLGVLGPDWVSQPQIYKDKDGLCLAWGPPEVPLQSPGPTLSTSTHPLTWAGLVPLVTGDGSGPVGTVCQWLPSPHVPPILDPQGSNPPSTCSSVGVTRSLLKCASVSGSTTRSRASSSRALMLATTSAWRSPSTFCPFTCHQQHGDSTEGRPHQPPKLPGQVWHQIFINVVTSRGSKRNASSSSQKLPSSQEGPGAHTQTGTQAQTCRWGT